MSYTLSCDHSWKTLPECVTQALEELETLQKEMQQHDQDFVKTSHELHNSFANLQSNTTAAIGTVQTKIDDLQSSTTAAIGTVQTKVDAVQTQVSGLSVGVCDCQNVDATQRFPSGYFMADYSAYCGPSGCAAGYKSIGVSDDDATILICRPCMNGDGSAELLAKKKGSCGGKAEPQFIST